MVSQKELKFRARTARGFVRDIIEGVVKIPKGAYIFHLTEKEFIEIITKKRLELIKTIMQKKPKSVQELADMLHRTKQAVDRDLKMLEKTELISLKRKGRRVIPKIEKRAIIFPLLEGKPAEAVVV